MSHQTRRDPLPVDYQYPTHGVDCDCPPCRDRLMKFHTGYFEFRYDVHGRPVAVLWADPRTSTTGYGFGV